MLTLRPLADELRILHVFSGLDDDQLAFLASLCRVVSLAAGEALFREGDPADVMFGVLEGEFRARREGGTPHGRLFVRWTGQIGGVLPFSRITHFPVTGRAVVASRLACFASSSFPEMLARIPELESRLAGAMADRVRETAQYDQQREMLMGLGKLPHRQRHRCGRPGRPNHPAHVGERRRGRRPGHRRLARHPAGDRVADLRALLHDEGGRRGDRSRARCGPSDRAGAPWPRAGRVGA